MEKIKAGIIGTGFIGPAHIEAVRRLGYVEMVALAEVDQKVANEKAKALNIPKAYGDYRKFLDDKEIKVVHNCTPNYLHFEVSKAIIESGKHIISEKPLAMNSKESKELVEFAKNKKVVNGIDFNYRYYPLVQQMKYMIANGELGKIYAIHGSYLQDWLYYETDYNWRVDAKMGGTSRAVADIGSHWCDLVQFITGLKIKSVFGNLVTIHPVRKRPKGEVETFAGKELKVEASSPPPYEEIKIETEDYASVLLKFDNGAPGVFTVSQVSAGRKNRLYFEIDGSKKSVAWNQEEPEVLWIGYREKPNEILMRDPSLLDRSAKGYASYPGGHPEGYPDGLKNFVRNVYRFISEGKDPSMDGEPDFSTFIDGHNEILICEAILESSKTQKWVDVPEF